MKSNILKTERLLIRPIHKDDTDAFFKYRSDYIANKYQGWIPKTINDATEFINIVSTKFDVENTWFQFVIVLIETNKVIGDIGVHFLNSEKKQIEIGCTLDKTQQGKGFATEALIKLINFLFNDLDKHRIIASIDPRNSSSIALFERLNFRKEAHFRESLLQNGVWVDDLIYAILKSEWENSSTNKL